MGDISWYIYNLLLVWFDKKKGKEGVCVWLHVHVCVCIIDCFVLPCSVPIIKLSNAFKKEVPQMVLKLMHALRQG